MKSFKSPLLLLAGLALVGCQSMTGPGQKEAATREWNHARVDAMASLAADQFKEGAFEKCEDTLGRALTVEPNNIALRLLAAKLSIEQNRLDVADAQLTEARKIDPKNAEADYLTGVVLQRWQHPEEARQAYASAAFKNPAELSYVMAQGEMLVTEGKPDDALALLKSKTDTFDHSAVLRDAIGQILVQKKQYDEAIAVLREATRLSADDLTPREHLAFALLAAKKYAEGADIFDRLAGAAGYEKRADIRAGLAECQSQAHRSDEARKNYDLATQLNPNCSGYWLGLARTCAEAGDYGAADLAARRAVSIDAADADAQCLLGYIRLKQNQLSSALSAFKAASDLKPNDSLSVCLQGYTLQRMGQVTEAQACYQKARQLDANDPMANALMVASVRGE